MTGENSWKIYTKPWCLIGAGSSSTLPFRKIFVRSLFLPWHPLSTSGHKRYVSHVEVIQNLMLPKNDHNLDATPLTNQYILHPWRTTESHPKIWQFGKESSLPLTFFQGTFVSFGGVHSNKLTLASWKVTILSRRYLFIHGCCSIVSFLGGVSIQDLLPVFFSDVTLQAPNRQWRIVNAECGSHPLGGEALADRCRCRSVFPSSFVFRGF